MLENSYFHPFSNLVGTDEAGRGPLAGPVVVAAVGVELEDEGQLSDLLIGLRELGVQDSKKLSSAQRQKILACLNFNLSLQTQTLKFQNHQLMSAWVKIDPQQIDLMNILQASLTGMKWASEAVVAKMKNQTTKILVDGHRCFKHDNQHWSVEALVKGDQKSTLIGLASIMAKEIRDKLMHDWHELYPQYGFDRHAGYPTKFHQEQLKKYGPSPIHRQSFRLEY